MAKNDTWISFSCLCSWHCATGNLRDASKKQAEERALDVEEAAEKGSSVENGPSAVATFR